MGMWTRDMVGNAKACEKGIQGLILTTPVRLNRKDFAVELVLYHRLKIFEA
jgi:hypothetical protein